MKNKINVRPLKSEHSHQVHTLTHRFEKPTFPMQTGCYLTQCEAKGKLASAIKTDCNNNDLFLLSLNHHWTFQQGAERSQDQYCLV